MTPVQSQALDLLAKIFIWSVRLIAILGGIAIVSGIAAGILSA